jgi:hypothetical protein
MNVILMPLCWKCTHFHPKKDLWVCDAFPDKIPDDIIIDEFDHHSPHEGDRGIQFKERG